MERFDFSEILRVEDFCSLGGYSVALFIDCLLLKIKTYEPPF
jgi:hypothetical protein